MKMSYLQMSVEKALSMKNKSIDFSVYAAESGKLSFINSLLILEAFSDRAANKGTQNEF